MSEIDILELTLQDARTIELEGIKKGKTNKEIEKDKEDFILSKKQNSTFRNEKIKNASKEIEGLLNSCFVVLTNGEVFHQDSNKNAYLSGIQAMYIQMKSSLNNICDIKDNPNFYLPKMTFWQKIKFLFFSL